MIKNLFARLTILTLTGTLLALPARAQDQDPGAMDEEQPAQTAGDRADQLLTSIDQTHGELVRLIAEVSETQGENHLLLSSQISELAKTQLRDLLALLDIFKNQETLGNRGKSLEQRAEQALRRSSRLLRSYILNLRAASAKEVTQRSSLAPSELQVFEHEMAERTQRLDRFYLGLIQLTDTMMAFGLNVDEERDFLSRQLTDRGLTLLRLLEMTRKELEDSKLLLKRTPEDGELQVRVFAAEERFDSNKTSLLTTIQMMKDQGLEFTDLEVRTLEITGEITPEALDLEVAIGLAGRSLERAKAYMADNGPRLLVRVLTIVAIVLVFWIVARLARRTTSRILDKTMISTSKLLKDMVLSMVGRVVMIIGFIFVLSLLGINLGPILAGLGIAGFIVGFALQDTLSNFAAGAMILAYQPYDIGDVVEAAGITGRVKDMNLVSTRILTLDHQTLIVPNSKIWGDVIRNVTAQPTRRVDMVFGISYEDEISKAERVLKAIVDAHDKVLADPEPIIKVHTLNASSVDFIVRPWANTDDYWDVYWDITREVKMRFDEEEISIPFPQRDVHLIAQAGSEKNT